MANTERFNTLQYVVTARKTVGDMRKKGDLDPKSEDLIEDAYDKLIELEDTLVLEDLVESVDSLRQHCRELSGVVTKMKRKAADLKELAARIKTAADAVGALAEIVAKASTAGIL